MKYIVKFTQYNVELGEAKTYEEKLNAYLARFGNTQNAFNYLINHIRFIEDTIKDAKIIEDDDTNRNNNKETTD